MCHGDTFWTAPGVPRLGIPPVRMSDGPHGVREEKEPHGSGRWGGATTTRPRCRPARRWPVPGTRRSAPRTATCWGGSPAPRQGHHPRPEHRDGPYAPGRTQFRGLRRGPAPGRADGRAQYPRNPARGRGRLRKTYLLNNQDLNRFGYNVEATERALFEIYLPPYEAAVREADVLSIMGSYARFFGQQMCHNQRMVQGNPQGPVRLPRRLHVGLGRGQEHRRGGPLRAGS